jgi:hypothetical protein
MTSQLPRRVQGAALAAIVPKDTGSSEVNLFRVPPGESVERRFGLERLHRVRQVGDSPEPAA